MNNFSNQNEQNRATSYYPEALNTNAQTMSTENSSPTQTQNPMMQNLFSSFAGNNSESPSNNPLSSLLGQNANMANLLGGNDMLKTLLSSGFMNNSGAGGGKNDLMMQAITGMLNNQKKSPTPSEERKEKIIDIESSFEDI